MVGVGLPSPRFHLTIFRFVQPYRKLTFSNGLPPLPKHHDPFERNVGLAHDGVDLSPQRSNAEFGPPIYEAVEDQLGLKLRPAKRPVEMIIIFSTWSTDGPGGLPHFLRGQVHGASRKGHRQLHFLAVHFALVHDLVLVAIPEGSDIEGEVVAVHFAV